MGNKRKDNLALSNQLDYRLELPDNQVVTGIHFFRGVDVDDEQKVGVRIGVKDLSDPDDVTWYPLGFLDARILEDLATYASVEAERLDDIAERKRVEKIEADIFGQEDEE